MSKTSIEWTDYTWNVVTGCTKVSAGCKNCYAETWAGRKMGEWKDRKFSDVKFHEDRLSIPSKRKKPTRFFVNSMSDLFHEKVYMDQIDLVIHVIRENPQHTFQILTKRPERALYFFNYAFRYNSDLPSNLWFGVSIENQDTANERIPLLLQIPAKVRFLSMEPLLSSVSFYHVSAKMPMENHPWRSGKILTGIDWVIVGGESGHRARQMNPLWVESIRDQCVQSGVKFFFKQWGEWSPVLKDDYWHGLGPTGKPPQLVISLDGRTAGGFISDAQEFYDQGWRPIQKIEKEFRTRLLDGREWNEIPELNSKEGD